MGCLLRSQCAGYKRLWLFVIRVPKYDNEWPFNTNMICQRSDPLFGTIHPKIVSGAFIKEAAAQP